MPDLAHFAEDDSRVSRSERRAMEKAIERGRCLYRSFDYAKTLHWFAEPLRPDAVNPEAIQAAFDRD